MGRKPGTRTASAAGAAANIGDVPTFTSFAAATAQALQGYSSEVSTPVGQHEWDSIALQLLKKLSKRDATTKEKALKDLSEHLKTLPSEPGVGTAFVTAWGESFRAAVQDPNPAVRIAALHLMTNTVQAFRRAVQHIFPSVLPLWLSAQGDLNKSVSEIASSSLERVLPTETHRKKVFLRYADDLKKHCDEAIAHIGSSDGFLAEAKRVIAILKWLLSASQTTSSIASIVDAEPHPLLLFAKGRKKKKASESALRDVCELAVFILSFMTRGSAEDEIRAAQFADIAVYAIRKAEAYGWDLTIVLLRDGWSSSFGSRLDKLSAVVCETVGAPVPTGVQALLPLFESLPYESVSGVLAEKVLGSMREHLHPSLRNKKRGQITVSYALTALLTYVQTASYSQRVLAGRWFSDDAESSAFAKKIFEDHVVPTCRLFVEGILPPVTKQVIEIATSRRRHGTAGSDKNLSEISRALGHVLRVMADSVSSQVISDIANGFGSSLSEEPQDERLRRFEYLVDAIDHEAREDQLVDAGITAIVQNDPIKPQAAVKTLAALLFSKAGKRLAASTDTNGNHGAPLLSKMYAYCKSLLKLADKKESTSDFCLSEIARVLSWVYTSSSCLDGGKTWSMIVTEMRLIGSKDIEYTLMTETILAQRQQRELFEDTGWIPLKGNDLDAMVVGTMKDLMHEVSEPAIRFVRTVADVEGGAKLSRGSWENVIMSTVEAIRKDENNEQMDPIIEAAIRSVLSELRFDSVCQELVSVSVARATQNPSILTQTTSFIEAYPSEKLVAFVESVGNVLLKCLHKAEELQLSKVASSTSAILSAFGKHGTNVSNSLSSRLLVSSTPAFVLSLLQETPFQFVFGDGVTQIVNVKFFNEVIENTCMQPYEEEVDIRLQTYLTELDGAERISIALNTTRLLLMNPQKGSEKIMSFLLRTTAESDSAEYTVISEELQTFWSDESQSQSSGFTKLSKVPAVIQICSVQSRGKCIESFRAFLEYIITTCLEHGSATDTVWTIETLTASLYGFMSSELSKDELLPPLWLQMIAQKALQSGREKMEQAPVPDVEAEHSLEAALANLLRVSILCFKYGSLLSDELTYWSARVPYVLQNFISNRVEELSWSDTLRLCFLTGLAKVLVNDLEEDFLSLEVVDELCYWGAWISVTLIPFLEKRSGKKVGTVDAWICSRWCGDLIMVAAETGTLLREDGEMPIPMGNIYSLIPSLSSSSVITRRAILTVVVHAATIDLSDRVASAFPLEGFVSEDEERAFVENIIPRELQDSLEWSGVPESQTQSHEESVSQEVGYLLAWRIFLDLMRSDDSMISPSIAADTGDVSFRRVGLSFLEEHPNLYKDFFKRCVEIVIDGSTEELRAARRAAVMAIQTEENAASGVILAKQSVRTEQTEAGHATQDSLLDGNSEAAVGHAAGIAFARALQRLPALSREIVTHELERGAASRVEAFVRSNLTALLIAAEVRKVKEWGDKARGTGAEDGEGELTARGSVAGREVWATYHFSDVSLEIGMRLPDVFPLQTVVVEARSRIGMSEAQWRKTLLGMATLLRAKNGSLAEALALWRRNLDKTFQGAEECPICYSVLHVATAALPKKTCRTCRNSFHSDCLLRWFSTSNTSACPTCRSVF
eukprot:TRINITY_DN1154_c0_g1_i1.p1 TRINITY_DN1154_c0_g1~~TRINITY_DN1154_c0_g1_i1.p1  ORF type:complete len:1631 (+),score=246.77 TRINITY_DN1154_c0_g1_i1:3299-8191(+)